MWIQFTFDFTDLEQTSITDVEYKFYSDELNDVETIVLQQEPLLFDPIRALILLINLSLSTEDGLSIYDDRGKHTSPQEGDRDRRQFNDSFFRHYLRWVAEIIENDP